LAVAPAPAAPGDAKSVGKPGPSDNEDEKPAWTHSRLHVLTHAEGAARRSTVALARPTGAIKLARAGMAQKGLLARELVRQAVLLAARDELGAATRDEVLGEAAPAAEDAHSADFAQLLRYDGAARVRVAQGTEAAKALLECEIEPSAHVHDLIALAKGAERLSRTEFPTALRSMGVLGTPNVLNPDAAVPQAVEERLDSLGLIDPLLAARELHAAIREDGESPARLGALVRAYANLGVLNEYLWTPAHKVFKARALLYAQRLIGRDPESPVGLWHRAYAEALTGLHKRALDDLTAAAALARRERAPREPAWVKTIEAFCHFDVARLKETTGAQAKFATFLRMLALEYPHQSGVALSSAKDVLALDPECFRAHDVLYRVGGVSNLHVATSFALDVLGQGVPRRVRAIAALPRNVGALPAGAGEVAVVNELERAGQPGADAAEPSWGLLGSMIRETRFVLVQHRLYFMRQWWNVPAEPFWDEARALVASHRYQPYLLALALGTIEADRAFGSAFDDAWLPDLEFTSSLMVSRLDQVAEKRSDRAWSLVQQHMDHLVTDFATQCDLYSKPNHRLWVHNANKILTLSPDNPYAMSLLVEADWDAIQPRLPEWEKKAKDFLPLVGALARRYSDLKQHDKARSYLERYIAESPEAWAYERLAAVYRAQGDNARWLATLQRYLAGGEDHGLEHARVRVQIAEFYMAERDWKQAQPYAEAAAQTWAAWAMLCAMRCYEGMEDWDRAELWARRVSERYPGSALRAWLDFCKRTGHGDRAAATAFVEQFLGPGGADAPAPVAVAANAPANRSRVARPIQDGFASWLSGSNKDAAEQFQKVYESSKTLLPGLALAALADERGDTAQRDSVLAEVCEELRPKVPKLVAVLQLFRDGFARGEAATPDAKALAHAVNEVTPNQRGTAEFAAGWFLKRRGTRAESDGYLKRAAERSSTNAWLKRIASDALEHPRAEPQPSDPDPPAPD
jgi:uncharacterized protein HemY